MTGKDTPHDHSYKRLFSHAEMVTQLLRTFVDEDWVAQLDREHTSLTDFLQ